MHAAVSEATERDRDIVDLLRNVGRDRAFEELLRRYEGKIYRLCRALLRDRTQAEDAAEESLVRVWNALDRYDGRASLSSWIYAITRNRCLTALERRRSHDSMDELGEEAEFRLAGADAPGEASDGRASYNDPLTAISFIDNDNGKTFAFPLTSSTVFLTKDEAPGPGGKFFLTQFEVDFAGQDSSSEIDYAGGLLLANAALMPPVPGINDVHLANLAPPDPAAFPNSFLGFETNNFSVVAIPLGDGTFDNTFSGQLLTSSAAVAPEFDAASTGAALTLLFGGLAVLRSRRSRRI